MTEAEAIDALYTSLSEGAIKNGQRFSEPEADWAPLWVVMHQSGEEALFTGTEHKHDLTNRVASFAKGADAIAIGHLHSSWGIFEENVSQERFEEIERQMLRQGGSSEGIPERREFLMLDLHTTKLWRMHRAMIERHPDSPPTLGEFELLYHSDDGPRAEGPMITPLFKALAR